MTAALFLAEGSGAGRRMDSTRVAATAAASGDGSGDRPSRMAMS